MAKTQQFEHGSVHNVVYTYSNSALRLPNKKQLVWKASELCIPNPIEALELVYSQTEHVKLVTQFVECEPRHATSGYMSQQLPASGVLFTKPFRWDWGRGACIIITYHQGGWILDRANPKAKHGVKTNPLVDLTLPGCVLVGDLTTSMGIRTLSLGYCWGFLSSEQFSFDPTAHVRVAQNLLVIASMRLSLDIALTKNCGTE